MLYVMEPKVFYNVAYYEQDAINEMVVYNVGSNCNDPTIPKLELFPRYGMNVDSKEFDSQYIDQLLNDDLYFINFMKIMISLKEGNNVFILIYNEETVFAPIYETLLKLIQKRYGYNYAMINSLEDYIDTDEESGFFTTPGIETFDKDYERYEQIIIMDNPDQFIGDLPVGNEEHL